MKVEEVLQDILLNKVLKIDSCEEFGRLGVTNNKIYILNKGQSNQCVLKIYYKDERKRLEREYSGYEFFTLLNSDLTPKPLYKNDESYFAVYSFIEGTTKKPSDVTIEESLQVADFIIYLHKFSQKSHEMGLKFMPAIASCFSTQETLDKINMKITKFLSDITVNKYDSIVSFRKNHEIKELFDKLVSSALQGLDPSLTHAKLPPDKQSLTPVDLNFSNILFHSHKAKFLDFEDFGWDDPVNIFGFFLHHEKTIGLSFENKSALINHYLEKMKPGADTRHRLKAILILGGVLWLSTYLLAMTDEKIKVRKFSDKNFDVEDYLKSRIEKFENKLDELNSKNESLWLLL